MEIKESPPGTLFVYFYLLYYVIPVHTLQLLFAITCVCTHKGYKKLLTLRGFINYFLKENVGYECHPAQGQCYLQILCLYFAFNIIRGEGTY